MSDVHIFIHEPASSDPRAHDAILHFLAAIKEKQTTMSDTLNARFTALESKLNEASVEILAELNLLRSQVVASPDALVTLERIESKAAALAATSPAVEEQPPTGEPA